MTIDCNEVQDFLDCRITVKSSNDSVVGICIVGNSIWKGPQLVQVLPPQIISHALIQFDDSLLLNHESLLFSFNSFKIIGFTHLYSTKAASQAHQPGA